MPYIDRTVDQGFQSTPAGRI